MCYALMVGEDNNALADNALSSYVTQERNNKFWKKK